MLYCALFKKHHVNDKARVITRWVGSSIFVITIIYFGIQLVKRICNKNHIIIEVIMVRYIYLLCLVLIMQGNIFSQVQIGGYIKTDNRFRIEQSGLPIRWNENQLRFELKATPSDKIRLYSDLRIRAFGFPNVQTTSDLQLKGKDKVNPWGLEFNEAYADISDFLVDNLDVRIGRQRIAWGTADKFNPTDNLNPDDLENLFDFGRHLGSNALKASILYGRFYLYMCYNSHFLHQLLYRRMIG